MAKDDRFTTGLVSKAVNAELPIRPASSGEEAIITNIATGGQATELYWYDGTNYSYIGTADGWLNCSFGITYDVYLIAKNIGTATSNYCANGVKTL